MNDLTPPATFRVQAAEGWLMLGNPLEAHEELEQITDEFSQHPVVLSMRWQVYAAARWWEAAFIVSKVLCQLMPSSTEAWICQANSLRQYKGVMEAWSLLLTIVHKFPQEPVIQYNLACYAAQMGLLEESCGWLAKAFETDESVQLKLAALYDPDLQPLWDKIGHDRLRDITGLTRSAVAVKSA